MNPAGRKAGKLATSHKLGFLLILLGLAWGLYLLRLTVVYEESQHRESDVLKQRIIELSKNYISALAKEHTFNHIGPPLEGRSLEPSEMKKATSLLLQNMLDRIKNLEDDLHYVIINSTTQFAKMTQQIAILNSSIGSRANESDGDFTWMCELPFEQNFPNCVQKVSWLKENWQTDPKYKNRGVNGSLCSFLTYLSEVESFCPKTFIKRKVPLGRGERQKAINQECVIPNDHAYPHCTAKVAWMKQYWKSDPYYASRGVDGSVCSFVHFLSEVEDWCPLLDGRKKEEKLSCQIPKDPSFPSCAEKIAWMRNSWKLDRCYADYGVNGSICSFIIYLSEVEHWCPLLPGRSRRPTPTVPLKVEEQPNLEQKGIRDLLAKLEDPNKHKYSWIKTRLTYTWQNWLNARAELEKKRPLKSYPRKRILIFIGLLADEGVYHFGENAASGGPLGELVQWSDLIASSFLLGHDIKVSVEKNQIKRLLGASASSYCPSTSPLHFDIIYLDYIGLLLVKQLLGNIEQMKCRLRIVDSFGTEAQFNHLTDKALKTSFGSHDLQLKQFNTMFPHSPDNTFLGFVVGPKVNENQVIEKKPIALVYGKHRTMWQNVQKTRFLDIVSEYFEVHATVGTNGQGKFTIPSYIKNHGVLQRKDLMTLLKSAKVFVGMGFPFEGPAPLEAIANGCFFINAKLIPPLNRENSQFFKSKPMFRKLDSQHPYAARFIGKPFVQTVNLDNRTELEVALKFIKNNSIKPTLPYEFTFEGTLERLYALTKYQDFCVQNNWPPLRNRKVLAGRDNLSCKEVCENQGMICEPKYFASINTEQMLKHHTGCTSTDRKASFVAPAVNSQGNVCTLQDEKLMFSCTANSPTFSRLCPCRDYIKGQVALCNGCI
ncbi:alpha-1,6-mannosylglycoprotein 6-beta-N-acetylglucosaminyltransferase A-like [Rhopilema esculentum]|uniref:alpha-1,6-mannosylglycoprotein 6-beta-N-acetylglucosaminyltransferase A-like n=1 Tax=Rhopilema esculentum TaxID=499914 RepID=UPI0031DE382E|eukprot:gene13255-4086_t